MAATRIRYVLTALLSVLALTVALLVLGAFSLQPAVPHPGQLSNADIRDIEQLIVDNSPSRFADSGERELALNAEELNLLAAFVLANIPQMQEISTRFELNQDSGVATASIPRHLGPLTLYLNLHAQFAQDQGRARLISLHAGHIPVPRRIIRGAENLAGDRLEAASDASQELAKLRHSVNATALVDGQLHLSLQWQPEVLSQVRAQAQRVLLSEEDRQRLLSYYTEISDIARSAAQRGRTVSLQSFVPRLFDRAAQRSENGSAVAENRSLLQALSLYVNNLSITDLLDDMPADEVWSPPPMLVTLYWRHDLGLHFVTAAAIAASAGVGIAEVLANSKEVYDARHRTGFSFSDMTANIAGMTLGEMATRDEDSARLVQQRLQEAEAERYYMPEPDTEDDGLSEEAFVEHYQDRNSARYLARLENIETLVSALPLYEEPLHQEPSHQASSGAKP